MAEYHPTQDSEESLLTPRESADVVRYYDNLFNAEASANGWHDKVSLGQASIRATLESYSLRPNGRPTLTPEEAKDGMDYIQHPPKSEDYYRKLEEIVDKQNVSYDEARETLDAEEADEDEQ